MKIIFQIVLCFFLLSSCSEPSEEKQIRKDLIEEEELIELLYDTYLYEGALKSHSIDSTYKDIKVVSFYDAILKKHKIERQNAQTSIEYYAKEEQLIPMLEKVKTRLKSRKNSLKENTTK